MSDLTEHRKAQVRVDPNGSISAGPPEDCKHGHCGHFRGPYVELSGDETGDATFQCYHCGAKVRTTWAKRTRRVPGHGVHHSETVRVYRQLEGWDLYGVWVQERSYRT